MNGVQSRVTAAWKVLLLSVACVFCNVAFNFLLRNIMNVSLFADTWFTVAMCFAAGLFGGILTGLLSPLASFLLYYLLSGLRPEISWFYFNVCILAEIFLVCIYHAKIKPQEEVFLRKPSLNSFTGLAVYLMVLVALDCVVISVLGGAIDFLLYKLSLPMPSSFEDTFELGLLRNNVPMLASAILSRIPINIIDRFFGVFGGYGISLVLRRW